MTLYLIAHKVRGEPAFDIAERRDDMGTATDPGPWWIIPTSGHRAYPYWSVELESLHCWDYADEHSDGRPMAVCGPMPDALRDHYESRPAPKEVIDLLALVNLPKPKMTIARRV